MAASHHTRSSSSPSALHPLAGQINEHLNRLRSSESASSSSSSLCQKLNCLHGLYSCVADLLQLPLFQQALSQEQSKTCIERILDGSLRLLDACSVAKDALLQAKESLHEFQSLMRRKRSLQTEAKKYFAARKSFKKAFSKIQKNLHVADYKFIFREDNLTLTILKNTEAVTISIFYSIFCFIAGSKFQEKSSSRWSFASQQRNQKHIACEEEETNANMFAKVDAALYLFINSKFDGPLILDDLRGLEMCIQDLEQGLECFFRSLIKVRVSVLNILA